MEDIAQAEAPSRTTDITIVLIGTNGSGKSHTGNTIIGSNKFLHCYGSIPVTENINDAEVVLPVSDHSQFYTKVIDTPGVKKIEDLKKILKEISESHRSRGFCVYLFVIPIGRFRDDDKNLLEGFYKKYSNIAYKTGIVLTRTSELNTSNLTVDGWLATVPTLKRVIDDYQLPYRAINNEDKDKKPQELLIELITEIHNKKRPDDTNKTITVSYLEMKDEFGNAGVQFFNKIYEKKTAMGIRKGFHRDKKLD